MTKEEAIFILRGKRDISGEKTAEALDMAIKALEQEPCEDAISRQAVRDGIDKYIDKAQSTGTKDDFISFEELVVKQLPHVTPQPKIGHWEYICNSEVNGLKICKCSNCEKKTYGSLKYCPNCGAKMEEVKE